VDSKGHQDWESLAALVKKSIIELFSLTDGTLADCIHAKEGDPAIKGIPDDALRPNQLFAITLGAVSDTKTGKAMLDACQSLLVPGAIRSLADAPIKYPLEILHNGNLINTPHYPYKGHYTGDEDSSRKPAYHNGSAWTWQFPSYCEAYAIVYGSNGISTARSMLTSSLDLIQQGCIGHFPEILDGDYPHSQRGCDAQAWGLSEWLRVWDLLKSKSMDPA